MNEIEKKFELASAELSEATHSNNKLTKKVEFEEQKFAELVEIRKGLEENIKAEELKTKEANAKVEKLSSELGSERVKIEEYVIRLRKANEEKEGIEGQMKSLQSDYDEIVENLVATDTTNKTLQEKNKESIEKASNKIKEL